MKSSKPRILSIGGGTGLSTLLRGLKNGPGALSVIVTVTDDGGSSGRLREDLGVMPPGDIRNCMIALSEDENLMSQLFRFRFEGKGDLHNHSFGNLFLSAMAGITRDFAEAVRLTSEVLAIKGVIYPATNSDITLRAELADGSVVEGETRITASRKKIRRIALNPAGRLAPGRSPQGDCCGGPHHNRARVPLHQPYSESSGRKDCRCCGGGGRAEDLYSEHHDAAW